MGGASGVTTEARATWAQALAWRMGRQLLDPVGSEPVAGVVRRLGAVLAMDSDQAELAVRTRRATSAAGELAAAREAGEVVTAFAYRGAVHHLAPEDAGDVLALRAAGRQWELPSWVEHYGLTPEAWPDFRAAVRAAVADGPLTVAELGRAVVAHPAYRHLAPVFDDGAITLLKALTWQGDVSLGLPRDGRLTLQRLDDNPRWGGIPDLDEAGPRAVLAYLRSYGPAPLGRLHYWYGEGLSAGRRRIDGWVTGLGDRLVALDVEGVTAYAAREDVDTLTGTPPSEEVRLLPGHDQWVIGPGTKDPHVTPPELRPLMTRKANPVVVGGVVRGTWTRQGDDVQVTWLGEGPEPTAALEAEVARLLGLLSPRGAR